jgi:hypothetical protein
MSDHAEGLRKRPAQRRRVNLGDPAVRAELARTADGRKAFALLARVPDARTKRERRHLIRATKRVTQRALSDAL